MATSPRLEELKTRFDENPRRYFAPLANEHRKLGDLERAIEICRSHLPAQPGHVSGHIVLAQALHESGRVEEARLEFEAALELDPENLIALRFMGDIARGHGDVDSARAWYERVLDADPRNDEVSAYLRALNEDAHQSASFAPPAVTAPDKRLTPVLAPQITETEENTPADTPAPTDEVPGTGSSVDFYYNTGVFQTENRGDAPEEIPPSGSQLPAAETKTNDRSGELVDGFFASDVDRAGKSTSASVDSGDTGDEPLSDAGQPQSMEQPDESSTRGAGTLGIDPLDFVPSMPDSASQEPLTADAGSQTPSSGTDVDEDLVFENLWNPGDTTSEFASGTAEEHRGAPEAANEQPGPDAGLDAYWNRPTPPPTPTPASVEYSDLAAVPEDWFSEVAPEPERDEPPTSDSHETEAADSSGTDEIDAWFDETAEQPEVSSGESTHAGDAATSSHGENTSIDELTPADPTPGWVIEGAAFPGAVDDETAPAPDEGTVPPANPEPAHGAWAAESGEPVEEPARQPEAQAFGASALEEAPQPAAHAADNASETPGSVPMGAGSEEAGEPPAAAQTSLDEQGYQSEEPRIRASTAPETPEEVAPAPFVTETLAELYLQQGFREEAIAIYRRLVDRSPFDRRLQEKLRALEAPAPTSASAETTPPVSSGPLAGVTVRTFFSSLARREPFNRGPNGGGSSSGAGVAGYDTSAEARESTSSDPMDFAPATREASSHNYGDSNSALARMFTANDPTSSDAAAAASLAAAFDVGQGASPPQGKPSHVSDREMSLDHLFRDSGGGQGGAVSMDEFYSSGSKPEARRSPPEGSEADERDPEITQFSAWLEGLKKK